MKRLGLLLMLSFFTACVPSSLSVTGAKDAGSLPSWSELKAHSLAVVLNDPDWKKQWWLEKTARVMRNGHGLDASDNLGSLMAMSESEVVRSFMKDPRFLDTVLDFNMYFLGFKMDEIHSDSGGYVQYVHDYPNAIASAQAAGVSGDFLKLFDLTGPVYVPPMDALTANANDSMEASLPAAEVRKKRVAEIQNSLQSIIDDVETATVEPSVQDVCSRVQAHFKFASSQIPGLRLPPLLVDRGPNHAAGWYPDLEAMCSAASVSLETVLGLMKQVYTRNEAFFAELLKYEKTSYDPKQVSEFKPFDLNAATMPMTWPAFGVEEAIALPNSSTNLNRKRASWVLNHFFCDDLTPIGVEAPADHATDEHASDPSCFACHYKLDPMAGFFRNYGALFEDFAANPTLFFDDGATVKRQTYVTNWQTPSFNARTWNIGYVRSVTDEKQNDYGESLEDLSRIIRSSPEAKQCLLRRLFQYFIDENQTIDAGYLNALTESFTKEASVNSTEALKNTIERLVTNISSHQVDPQFSTCYDHAPGTDSSNAPPCQVAALLQRNCVQCHSTAHASAGLDLSTWQIAPDGTQGFPHLVAGKSIAFADTDSQIIDRLSTADLDSRMPLMKNMTPIDRQELYVWTQGQLKASRP